MKKQISGKIITTVVCAILAFGLTVQLKNESRVDSANTTYTARAEQLQVQLNEEKEKNEELYAQVIQYQKDLDNYKQKAEDSGGYASVLAQQLDRANLFAGLSKVEGEGITVTMHDSEQSNTENVNENFFIIHDEDILRVVNELRDSGAEAISINGERLLATSEIRCSGSTVSINNSRFASPFVISAIGDADEMQAALTMRQGVVDVLGTWGIKLDIKKVSNLVIDAYTGSIEFRHANTVKAK